MLFNKENNGKDEIQAYASQVGDHDFDYIQQAVELSEADIVRFIGQDTYDRLEAHYESENYEAATTDEIKALTKAVKHAQGALANFAYRRNIGKDAVLYGNGGITVKWSEDYRPATPDQLAQLSEALKADAFAYISKLLKYMVKKADIFTEFAVQKGEMLEGLAVSTMATYEKYVELKGSEARFFNVLARIRTTQETEVANLFGGIASTGYAELLEYIKNNEQAANSFTVAANLDSLPETPDEGDLVLVNDIQVFYKYSAAAWARVCKDMSSYYTYIQKLLVFRSRAEDYRAHIDELTGANDSRIAGIRANADMYDRKADTEAALANTAIEAQNAQIEAETQPDTTEEATEEPYYWGGDNSFMI